MLEEFIDSVQIEIWLIGAVFLRIGPALSMAPGYGETFVSPRVKLVVALLFSAAAAPVLEPYLPQGRLAGRALVVFVLLEITIGFFIGLVSRGIIFLLQKAGAVISQSISLAQMLGNTAEPLPVMSHVLTTAGLAILFSTSLANQMLFGFVLSYTVSIPSLDEITGYSAEKITELMNYLFNHGVVLASGVASALFVYYLVIGFINKAMPQFMVSFIGIPFVALYSIYFMQQHSELLLRVWQEKALIILMMPFESPK
jgi:flagellar biosynthetic protein FliR